MLAAYKETNTHTHTPFLTDLLLWSSSRFGQAPPPKEPLWITGAGLFAG